jgi:hypothetical protein
MHDSKFVPFSGPWTSKPRWYEVPTDRFEIGFIGHLQAITTNNYNTMSDLHTLQITTAHTKYFPACVIFTRRFLVTASNNGYTLLPCSGPLWTAAPFHLNLFLLQTPIQNWLDCQSQSQIATDDQSISKSWCRAPDLFVSYGIVFWGALSDERPGLSFVYAADPRQRSLSRVRVRWVSWPYFTVSDLRLLF